MSGESMDGFSWIGSIVGEYRRVATLFRTIRAEYIRSQIEVVYAPDAFWPDPRANSSRGGGAE